MYRFPVFQSHIDLAHKYWQMVVKPGDLVIDATCGNGRDTLALAKMALTPSKGALYSIDIQQTALDNAMQLLATHVENEIFERIQWVQSCHSKFPHSIIKNSIKLIAYNLGYLPGGDKSLTTLTQTTIASLKNAMELVQPGGIISVACYPGHSEGRLEEAEVINFLKTSHSKIWSCCHHRWINRSSAPSLIILQRSA